MFCSFLFPARHRRDPPYCISPWYPTVPLIFSLHHPNRGRPPGGEKKISNSEKNKQTDSSSSSSLPVEEQAEKNYVEDRSALALVSRRGGTSSFWRSERSGTISGIP
mmetsp:Transcript_15348/g.50174  ORF Transcript_15348/g.50174 Transcript_15348/m.50174 type:complete len:107 (+) Transcript_15348:2400-2720(+)